MIKLSVRAMAKYLVSDEPARIQLLREQKYMAPEAIARARFYSEARTTIARYHRGTASRDTIEARIISMRQEARYSNPNLRSELVNNADVLERYLYYQGNRALDLAPPPTAELVRSGVEVRVQPSLFGLEDDTRRLIFLELRERCSPSAMRVIAELAFEAFRPVLRDLAPRAIQVVDVRSGIVTELQHAGSSIGRELAQACKTITTLWPQIPPPSRGQRASPQDERPTERQLSIAWDFEPERPGQ
jgi:hypothetical protein